MRIYHRNTAIFAGIFTLLQAGLWDFFAVWSVGVYSCAFDYPYLSTTDNTVANLFYYSYLQGPCRYDTGTVPSLNTPKRTYVVMLVHGIVSAVWIPSSILLLVAAVNRIHGKMGARCYYPWLFTTAVLVVLDVVITIIYAIDISKTLSMKDYLETFRYVEATQVRGMDGLTVIPAIIMTVYFSRALVIWLINIIVFGVMIQAVISMRRMAPTAKFVEREARVTPTDDSRDGSSNWVRMAKRSIGMPNFTTAELNAITRAANQASSPSPPRTRRPRLPDAERRGRQGDRQMRTTQRPPPPCSPPPPPPPAAPATPPSTPFYDVYGNPTTPDSPQPAFASPSTPSDGLAEIDPERPWSYVNKRHQLPGPPHPGSSGSVPAVQVPEPDYTLHRPAPRRPNLLPLSVPSVPEEEGETPLKRFQNNPNVWKVMP